MLDTSLLRQNLLFGQFLRDHGFKVFFSNIMDAVGCLENVDILSKEDFCSVLRANLVTNDMEYRLFDDLFKNFWENRAITDKAFEQDSLPDEMKRETDNDLDSGHDIPIDKEVGQPEKPAMESLEMISYSPVSIVEKKDIDQFRTEDIQVARLIARNMLSSFRTTASRRKKQSKKSAYIDFPRTIRKSLKFGDMPSEFCYRNKRKRLKRLVIIADVSGSMSRYSGFIIPFLLSLRSIGSRAEVFVFSTSLSSVTNLIRKYTIDKALEKFSESVGDWSGGTRIGYSLNQFSHQHGGRLLNRRSVIVIISDGWDLGARVMLKSEMKKIQQNAFSSIWLNPMAGEEGYRPVCKGMQTAIKYVDHFLPANNLQNLRRAGRIINKIIT